MGKFQNDDLELRFGTCIKNGKLRKGDEVVVRRSELTTPHFAFLGLSGSGKSTLIESLVDQLLDAGEGVTVIDPGNDLANGIAARFVARAMERNDLSMFDRFHWLEPGSYTMLFGLDPAQFDPANPIPPGQLANARAAWKHTAVQTYGELIQMKQGQMDFEQNARLQRIMTRALSGAYEDVRGTHLPIPFSLWLLDPSLPNSDEIFALLEPLLDDMTLSDIRRIRGYRRVEDRLREIESFMNRFNAAMPPQARAIFSAESTVPIRKIIQQSGLMLWQVAPTEYFSHDGKSTFGKIAMHATITAMMTMPPELRVRHTIIIDESSEFASPFIEWALGATRKTGLSLWLVAQDRSSFRKGDFDMRPKVTSQCNPSTFQQSNSEDVEELTKIMRSGELSFKPLIDEVQMQDGYDMLPTRQVARSKQTQKSWQRSKAKQHGHTHTTGKGKKTGRRVQKGKSKGTERHSGDSSQRSYPQDRPNDIQLGYGKQRGGGENEGENESEGFEEGETETETDAEQESETETDGVGGGVSDGVTVTDGFTPLGRVKLVKKKTGQLEKSISDQREKQYAEMRCLPKRCGFLYILGQKRSIKFKTDQIDPAFDTDATQRLAIEFAKQQAYARHDYYFLPNFDPRQEVIKIRRWIELAAAQPAAIANQAVPLLLAAPADEPIVVNAAPKETVNSEWED